MTGSGSPSPIIRNLHQGHFQRFQIVSSRILQVIELIFHITSKYSLSNSICLSQFSSHPCLIPPVPMLICPQSTHKIYSVFSSQRYLWVPLETLLLLSVFCAHIEVQEFSAIHKHNRQTTVSEHFIWIHLVEIRVYGGVTQSRVRSSPDCVSLTINVALRNSWDSERV